MTLVIGITTGFLGGAILSDTRVTFPCGGSREMLRKAYPVGNFVAAGFAGSVTIGFALIRNLTMNLQLPIGAETDVWEPFSVARAWAPLAKAIFDAAPSNEQQLGSRVLIAAHDPKGSGVRLIRFASPDFSPKFLRQGLRTCSIGSGAGDRRYMRVVRPHADIRSSPASLLQAGVAAWTGALADSVGHEAATHPRDDVGHHFHVLTVEQHGFTLHASGRQSFVDWQDEPIDLDPMPVVATSFTDFCELARAEGLSTAAARC